MKRIYDKLETTQTFAGHRLRLSKANVLVTTTMKYPRQASNLCVTHQKSFVYSFLCQRGVALQEHKLIVTYLAKSHFGVLIIRALRRCTIADISVQSNRENVCYKG